MKIQTKDYKSLLFYNIFKKNNFCNRKEIFKENIQGKYFKKIIKTACILFNNVKKIILIVIFLLYSNIATASFRIIDYVGSPANYALLRNGKQLPFNIGNKLEKDDELKVLSNGGAITLEDNYNNKEIRITNRESPYTVLESSMIPSIWDHIYDEVKKISRDFTSEKTKKVEGYSRGNYGKHILISGASLVNNQLVEGFDSLSTHWKGGDPPFDIRLLNKYNNIIFRKAGITSNNAILNLSSTNMGTGKYTLKIFDKNGVYADIYLTIANDNLPDIYTKILKFNAPTKIKQSYAVITLSSYKKWKFQALQYAEIYNLQQIKNFILNDHVPCQKQNKIDKISLKTCQN